MSIAENIARIRQRIAEAALRAGRQPGDIALMAVSKTMPADRIREAFEAGQRLFGENRVQEFQSKHAELSAASPALPSRSARCSASSARFHLIGHLQSNKAAKAAELFQAVDSLDSLRLAERLDGAAAKLGKTLSILIEINIGGEQAKSGVEPGSAELLRLFEAMPSLSHLELRGLMTVPPFTDDPEGSRPYFRRLRELRDRLAIETKMELPELSMGMSHDFEVAIEEGSTLRAGWHGNFRSTRRAMSPGPRPQANGVQLQCFVPCSQLRNRLSLYSFPRLRCAPQPRRASPTRGVRAAGWNRADQRWCFIAIWVPLNVYCWRFPQVSEFLWSPRYLWGKEACLQQ